VRRELLVLTGKGSTSMALLGELAAAQVRFCRDRFSATGDLGYRGVRGAED
jgi:hypothetical protein